MSCHIHRMPDGTAVFIKMSAPCARKCAFLHARRGAPSPARMRRVRQAGLRPAPHASRRRSRLLPKPREAKEVVLTKDEAAEVLRKHSARAHAISMKIVEEARPLVAVLKDAGRQHSAEPLAALYFELEAATEEAVEAALVNPQVLREVLMESIVRR